MIATERVLCAVSMMSRGFREHVEAASAGGWDSISVLYPNYLRAQREENLSDADMRAILADNNMRVDEMEVCHEWAHGGELATPLGQPGPTRTCACGLCAPVDELLRVGSMLGAKSLVATQRTEPLDVATGAERLAALCDKAAEHDMKIAIEYIPYSPMAKVGAAWAVIEASGRANAGLCLDTHHHLSVGGDDADLRQVPAERFFVVQITDGVRFPEGASRAELFTIMTTRGGSVVPGQGELNVDGTLRVLDEMGVRAPVGTEVRRPEWDGRSANEVSVELREMVDGYLDRADAA